MFTKIINSLLLMIFMFSITVKPQENRISTEQWMPIKKNFINNIVIITDNQQKISKGLLTGVKGDSIFLAFNNKVTGVNFKNIFSLSIEDRSKNYRAAVSGAFTAIYFGTLLFFTSSNQSLNYLEYKSAYILGIAELVFASLGGGIGSMVDNKSKNSQQIFIFNGDDESLANELIRLKEFLMDAPERKRLKFNIYSSQVRTRYTEVVENSTNQYYMNPNSYYFATSSYVHNFNLFRRFSVTYEFFDRIEFGAGLVWFGEPSFTLNKQWSEKETNNSESHYYSYMTQTYDGLGYFAVVNTRPLRRILPDYFDLVIGGGIGLSKVDYNHKININKTGSSGSSTDIIESSINKTFFSSFISSEFRFYFYPEISLSLQADYVYIPEKMPAIPYYGLNERDLGNFSLGFGVGFNF